MNPVPLAVGCTQPVTVTSFPSLTVIFDFVVCSVVCACSPTAQAADRATAPMNFMALILLSGVMRLSCPCTPAVHGSASAVSRLLAVEPISLTNGGFADAHVSSDSRG